MDLRVCPGRGRGQELVLGVLGAGERRVGGRGTARPERVGRGGPQEIVPGLEGGDKLWGGGRGWLTDRPEGEHRLQLLLRRPVGDDGRELRHRGRRLGADLGEADLGPVARLRVLERLDEHRHRVPLDVGERLERGQHDGRIRVVERLAEQGRELGGVGDDRPQGPQRGAPGPRIGVHARLHERLDRGLIGRGVLRAHLPVVRPHHADRGRGLGDDDRVGIGEELGERRQGGDRVFADQADGAGRVPPQPRVGVGRRRHDLGKRVTAALAERRDRVDREHADTAVVGRGERAPQRGEVRDRRTGSFGGRLRGLWRRGRRRCGAIRSRRRRRSHGTTGWSAPGDECRGDRRPPPRCHRADHVACSLEVPGPASPAGSDAAGNRPSPAPAGRSILPRRRNVGSFERSMPRGRRERHVEAR